MVEDVIYKCKNLEGVEKERIHSIIIDELEYEANKISNDSFE